MKYQIMEALRYSDPGRLYYNPIGEPFLDEREAKRVCGEMNTKYGIRYHYRVDKVDVQDT